MTTTQCIYPLCPGADPGLFPAWGVPELRCYERSSTCLWWIHMGISVGSTGAGAAGLLCVVTPVLRPKCIQVFSHLPGPLGWELPAWNVEGKAGRGAGPARGASGNPREVIPTRFTSQVPLSPQCLSCPWFELICLGRPIAGTRKSPKFALGV